jgi:5-methylcytosine-specific restriction endonuclease McrA
MSTNHERPRWGRVQAEESSAIAFGAKLLALLGTGSFTTSYKYALLLSMLDAVIEGTEPDGSPPTRLSGRDLGSRVFALYWRQARPYTERGPLRQSGQRDLIIKIAELRDRLGLPEHVPLEMARRTHPDELSRLEREVIATVVRYPIVLLQRFGRGATAVEDRFIYDISWDDAVPASQVHRPDFDDRLILVAGAAEHLSALAGLVRPLVEREWLRHVARRNEGDVDELRLEAFLFGSERTSLVALREPLLGVQRGRCFYCQAERGPWEVDHFLPWSRWPDDRLDNLVVADRRCNSDKGAALAAVQYLEQWWTRTRLTTSVSRQLAVIADDLRWPRRTERTAAGARGLYQHQPLGTMLWGGRGVVEPLDLRRLEAVFRGVDVAAEGRQSYLER